jgi:hypothetical protein
MPLSQQSSLVERSYFAGIERTIVYPHIVDAAVPKEDGTCAKIIKSADLKLRRVY